jgi:rSAM/selenodomain-associated transferase 2
LTVSIVLPVLNEGEAVGSLLSLLADFETIVVDGGSTDDTVACARAASRIVESERGRAAQMNAGAAVATGDVILFLHADTSLPRDFERVIDAFASSDHAWGRFDVRLSGDHFMFRVIETMMNYRSFLTGISTGDQAIFVKRDVFEEAGGYAAIPLMEDVEMSRRLRRVSWPYCSRSRVTTSSRRWEENGIGRTILQMWWLRLRYFFGASPETLVREYYD